MSRKKQPKGLDAPIIGTKPVEKFFSDIEYVDPDEDRCLECNSSFGVHLITCSKFSKP